MKSFLRNSSESRTNIDANTKEQDKSFIDYYQAKWNDDKLNSWLCCLEKSVASDQKHKMSYKGFRKVKAAQPDLFTVNACRRLRKILQETKSVIIFC